MENLLNYVHLRRDIDFSIRPFNDVDMLVCADLSYVDWDGIVEKDEVSLEEACRKYLSLYSEEELKSKYTFSMNLPHLIDALQDTIRYGNIKLKNYKKVYSDEDVIQFSVVTLVLPDGSFVISFSGTDGSITGWKENLMMTYSKDLPCQILAKDYVKETIYSKSNNIVLLTIIESIGMHFENELPGYALDLATSIELVYWDTTRYMLYKKNPTKELLERQILKTMG
ncbi:MAG: DUF2974 domain-containing protein, partial [Holdemanella biformis]|nr:DUF2974 domain-containing protein [Holdemanella biformis]